MIKQVALLKIKAGMSHDAFVDRYENGHVPLIHDVVPFFSEYRRSFVIPGSMVGLAHVGAAAPAPDFNSLTEIWYENQERLDTLAKTIGETDAGDRIAADEEDLFDRTRMVMFTVDERVTPTEELQPRPAGHHGRPAVKQISLLKAKPGMSRDAFIDYYEKQHTALAMKVLTKNGKPIFAEYSRSYPVPGGGFDLSHVKSPPAPVDFDVITQIWFWTEADYQEFLRQCGDAEISRALSADEKNLFDRNAITTFRADERISPK